MYDFYVDEEIQIFGDKVIATFSAYSLVDVASYLLAFGSDVIILGPKKLITEHQRLVKDLQKNY